MATISDAADARRPPAWALMREGAALLARFYRAFGSLEERGPADGPRLMLIPGFMATDRTTLGLQRALAVHDHSAVAFEPGQYRAGEFGRIVERDAEHLADIGGGDRERLGRVDQLAGGRTIRLEFLDHHRLAGGIDEGQVEGIRPGGR